MYKHLLIIFGFAVVFFTYASTYLSYSDKPIISDVIVLFVGPDYIARLKEAHKLIEEGYANTIIIPAQNTVLVVSDGTLGNGGQLQKNAIEKKVYPHYYENTQIEVLEAKRMMDKAGYKSAMFVSSPYHMRRIKIIASSIFREGSFFSWQGGLWNDESMLTFVPSRYINASSNMLALIANRSDLNVIYLEYIKIIWFIMYEPFAAL